MNINGHLIMIDGATRFDRTMSIRGWVQSSDALKEISLAKTNLAIAQVHEVKLREGTAPVDGRLTYDFTLQVLTHSPYDLAEELFLELQLTSGSTEKVSLKELSTERFELYRTPKMYQEFIQRVKDHTGAKVLDIGGRDRSQYDRAEAFPGVDYTVLDIVPSSNVDVVGDAHQLSQYFSAEKFDYVFSSSVFEHLAMPWKVVLEINKVLKVGGFIYTQAPHTCGLHDMPWDFWRFSDASWDAIFNEKTGFEIVDRALDYEAYILPFLYRSDMNDAEKAAGFENSAVLARKISNTELTWDVDPAEIMQGEYPQDSDSTSPSLWSHIKGLLKRR
ncbi:MAG: methyltransferase domain-containing protein [Actinomycetota bacterium]